MHYAQVSTEQFASPWNYEHTSIRCRTVVSQSLLGDAYAAGRGVKKDLAEAKKWYALAAAQGNDEARDELKNL